MLTPNMSDEELDSVFRRVADEYPPEAPPPGAWERLDDQLATAATTQQLRSKVLRAFGAEVATVAVLLWLGSQLLPQRSLLAQAPVAELPTTTATAYPATTEASRARLTATVASARTTTTPAGGSSATAAAPNGLSASPTTARASLATVAAPEPLASASTTAKRVSQPRLAAGPVGRSASSVQRTAPVIAEASRTRSTASTSSATRHTVPVASAFNTTHRTLSNVSVSEADTPASLATPLTDAAGSTLSVAKTYNVVVSRPLAKPTHKQALLGAAPSGEHARRVRSGTVLVASNYLPVSEKTATNQPDNAENLPVARLAEAPQAGRAAQLPLANYSLPESLAGVALLPPADSTKEPKKPAARPPYRVVLGLLGAPSFSAVRTAQSAQIGADYGLTLEYLLTPRLRVRAGLISSQKRYRAASSDYEAPTSWQWFAGDYMLDANCRITEIPLDLRFDVLRRPTYALFTSVGINSLLMRNERYSYDWTMNGQTFTKTAQVVNGSNHFLSVLNLSVGVERPIGGRWSAQVEPFWQLPLGGVGAGKVRLSSAGASFSLKFGLIR